MTSFVVVETEYIEKILGKILPSSVSSSIRFIVGDSRYGAESMAQSLATSRRAPIALVLSSRCRFAEDVEDERMQAKSMLSVAGPQDRYEVFVAYPGVAATLFTGSSIQEKLMNKGVSPRVFSQIKQSLSEPLSYEGSAWSELANAIDDEVAALLRENDLIQRLTSFLEAEDVGAVRVVGPRPLIDHARSFIENRIHRKDLRFAGIVSGITSIPPSREEVTVGEGQGHLLLNIAHRVAKEDVRPILQLALRQIASESNLSENLADQVKFYSEDVVHGELLPL